MPEALDRPSDEAVCWGERLLTLRRAQSQVARCPRRAPVFIFPRLVDLKQGDRFVGGVLLYSELPEFPLAGYTLRFNGNILCLMQQPFGIFLINFF